MKKIICLFFIFCTYGSAYADLTQEQIDNFESLYQVRWGQPDIQTQIKQLLKTTQGLDILKLANTSGKLPYLKLVKLNQWAHDTLYSELESMQTPLLKRVHLFIFFHGLLHQLGFSTEKKSIEDFFNIAKLIESHHKRKFETTDDFKTAQQDLHALYLVIAWALIRENRKIWVKPIKRLIEAIELERKQNHREAFASQSQDKEDLARRSDFRNHLEYQKMLTIELADVLSRYQQSQKKHAPKKVGSFYYTVDTLTGVIKAKAWRDTNLSELALYWTGKAVDKTLLFPLNSDKSEVTAGREIIVNAFLPTSVMMTLGDFVLLESFDPFKSEFFGQGPNCFNTSLRYFDWRRPLEASQAYEIKSLISAKKLVKVPHGQPLKPGDLGVITVRILMPAFQDPGPNGLSLPTSTRRLEPQYKAMRQIQHSFVHLVSDFTYSKASKGHSSPYRLGKLEQEIRPYAKQTQMQIDFYRLPHRN